jgi:hypothetical protein
MEIGELELFATHELIEELMRRKTFLGVVIHSEAEMRGRWMEEHLFRVHFNGNLSATEASRLLETVADAMERI